MAFLSTTMFGRLTQMIREERDGCDLRERHERQLQGGRNVPLNRTLWGQPYLSCFPLLSGCIFNAKEAVKFALFLVGKSSTSAVTLAPEKPTAVNQQVQLPVNKSRVRV